MFACCGYPIAYATLLLIISPYLLVIYVVLEACINPRAFYIIAEQRTIECWYPMFAHWFLVLLGMFLVQYMAMLYEWGWSFKSLPQDKTEHSNDGG